MAYPVSMKTPQSQSISLMLNWSKTFLNHGKTLDLELLLNRIGSIFRLFEGEALEDETLQAALTSQISKSKYKGTQAKNQTCPKHVQNSRPNRAEQESNSRLTKLILDLLAEIRILLKAMVNHGISVESAPTSNKQKEQSAVVKQNGRYAGIAKKKNRNRQMNSLVEPLSKLIVQTKNPKSKHMQ
jgi:hypothetical protein